MASINDFEEYRIWKEARILCQTIFEITNREPFCLDISLKRQIRASSGSVMDNIAEGHERGGNKEFISFLGIARGSCGEVKSQLYRALDRSYITSDEFNNLYFKARKLGAGITKLMQYLKDSNDRGFKFH